MSMVPRGKVSEDQIAAAKVMPGGNKVDNAGNPINSLSVEDALGVPSGKVRDGMPNSIRAPRAKP